MDSRIFNLPRNLTEAKSVVSNNMQEIVLLFFALLMGLYPLVVPANLRYNKVQLQESAFMRCRTGQGLAPLEFCYYLIIAAWILTFYAPKLLVLYFFVSLLTLWVAPFREIGEAAQLAGKWINILGKAREQLRNIVPYANDLLPVAPKLLPYTQRMLENIDRLGPALPKMMEEKEYMIPILPDLLEKLDVILPIMDDLLPNLHKLAPHVKLLLPKIELFAPHIKRLLPLWDQLEPRLPILVDEIDNLAPYMNDTVPYIDRLIPMLDLLPLIHESGVLKYDLACKALPLTARFLPPETSGFQRSVLSKLSSSIADLHVKGQQYLKDNDIKLLPWKRQNCDIKS